MVNMQPLGIPMSGLIVPISIWGHLKMKEFCYGATRLSAHLCRICKNKNGFNSWLRVKDHLVTY